jgi:pimeloyl-ACP methyl ester carboxylesterase
MIKIAGVQTHVRREGRGEPVILLHGLGASSYSWRYVLSELSRRFEVFAPDLPGFGRSEKPLDFDYSFGGMHRWLIAFMDQLGIARARFVGNSMGGVISLWTAIETPQRIERMALLGTPAYPRNRPRLLGPLSWPIIGRLYEDALGDWTLRWIARRTFVNPAVITPELLSEYGEPLRTPGGRRALAEVIRRSFSKELLPRIARYGEIRVPTLVLIGDSDSLIQRPDAERFAGEIRGARFQYLDNCGHAPQEDTPERVNPILLDFLA